MEKKLLLVQSLQLLLHLFMALQLEFTAFSPEILTDQLNHFHSHFPQEFQIFQYCL